MSCRSCEAEWKTEVEKQGDVNVAVSLINDAHKGVFDVCYLVTTDGDQAPTLKIIREEFPRKEIVTVSPPNREPNKMLKGLAHRQIKLNRSHIEKYLFPKFIQGAEAILRPQEYDT